MQMALSEEVVWRKLISTSQILKPSWLLTVLMDLVSAELWKQSYQRRSADSFLLRFL